jgi:hypothetical protein
MTTKQSEVPVPTETYQRQYACVRNTNVIPHSVGYTPTEAYQRQYACVRNTTCNTTFRGIYKYNANLNCAKQKQHGPRPNTAESTFIRDTECGHCAPHPTHFGHRQVDTHTSNLRAQHFATLYIRERGRGSGLSLCTLFLQRTPSPSLSRIS